MDDLFDSWWSLIERIRVYVDADAFLRVLAEVLFIFEVAELEILSEISHPIDQNVPSCNTKIKKKSLRKLFPSETDSCFLSIACLTTPSKSVF